MKKIYFLSLVLGLITATFTGCSALPEQKSSGVMSHDEFITADLNSTVTIETYVQASQSCWNNTISLYTQDRDGGYFIYSAVCSEEDAKKLVPGTKIKVTGVKKEWSGEIELSGAPTFEIEEGSYIAIPTNVTELLGTDKLWNHQNEKVAFKNMTVEPINDDQDAIMYGPSGTGFEGDDIYINLSADGKPYTFVVESYLTDKTSDTYQNTKNLKVGDVIDVEGFLYWYNGPQPHILSFTVK